jgi:hypothetical protein
MIVREVCGAVDLLSGSICNRSSGHPGPHRDSGDGIEISWFDEATFAAQKEVDNADQDVSEFVSYYTDFYD